MKRVLALLPLLLAGACATTPKETAADRFFANLSSLCGKAFAGRVTSSEAQDDDMRRARLVMHVRDCSASEIRIPFHVGRDASRTWIVSRTAAGLRLKHDHRHADGSEDELSRYGGDSSPGGSETRQEFPADAFTKQLFRHQGITASVDNVWAVEVRPGAIFAYELRRPQRFFRVEFDLARPVQPPR